MMGGDDDDGDTIVETQEISSENLFQNPSQIVRRDETYDLVHSH